MEQKIFYSSINETVKNDYLRFCAVLKYSYINTYNIIDNPRSSFYPFVHHALMQKGKKEWTIAAFVVSDAGEAVWGAKNGAAAGAAAGPVGAAVGGVIGAVAVGGMSSAVKYACTETIKQKVFHVKD